MAMAKINVNTDAETKRAAEDVFNAVGMNMTTAINVFLKKAIQYKGIPFDVCVEVPNETTLASFSEAEKIMSDPKRKGYKNIDELKAALDK